MYSLGVGGRWGAQLDYKISLWSHAYYTVDLLRQFLTAGTSLSFPAPAEVWSSYAGVYVTPPSESLGDFTFIWLLIDIEGSRRVYIGRCLFAPLRGLWSPPCVSRSGD